MNRHHVILHSFCLLLLTACATDPAQRHLYLNDAIKADSFVQKGDHKKAANLYQTLAESKPAHRIPFSLLAAEAFIQSGDSLSAQSHADSIDSNLLSIEQQAKLNLLYAQISLSRGDAEQALDKLSQTNIYNLSSADKIIFYQSLAFAHSLTGNQLQSAQARIQLDPLLKDPEVRDDNKHVILNTLSLLASQTLILEQPSAPDVLGGWMALTIILKSKNAEQNQEQFQSKLHEWHLAFPQHPADTKFLQSYSEGSQNTYKLPSTIAFLLPGSGRFAQAAEVIKKGFLEAYNHDQSSFKPSIRFYDTSIDNPVNLYHQAISEGAELIIGPLNKENIQTLILSTDLTVPVLALNHIENIAKDNLFQFGLSPIDEINQLISNATENNHAKALLLTPESNQGHRIANYLTEYLQESGSTLLEAQTYNTKESDFSTPIKDLLNLGESKYRYRQLKKLLARNIEYTDRRRQDVDAIFLSSSTHNARSIHPQLRFYRATKLPIYATSQIYSGHINPALDIDLNNIIFCDIPWLFPETYPGDLSQESLRSTWQQLPNKYIRLLALGIDSFNILPHLKDLDNTPYAGATGTLSLNLNNRITRQLVCAQFVDGKPVLQQHFDFEEESTTEDDNIIFSDDLVQ
ncbi:MAG: penicillin-binding protein activator [Methylococcales bacterium]|nr:penicillin-binding protein activator [Methylococcales bacterium]